MAIEIWDLPEEESNIIPALILSSHHLPSHLKRCFAFCALFAKKLVFQKVHLILFLMAENFLQCPRQGMSMEEVGEQYFNELFRDLFFRYQGNMKCILLCTIFSMIWQNMYVAIFASYSMMRTQIIY